MKCRAVLLAATLLGLPGCNDTATSVVCSPSPGPAVSIFVVDEAQSRSLAGEAHGWYRVGTREDSLRYRTLHDGDFLAAYGTGGFYDIEVHVEGRLPWLARSIRVADGVCGPETVRLLATPQAAP
jgi:hypothetical protein